LEKLTTVGDEKVMSKQLYKEIEGTKAYFPYQIGNYTNYVEISQQLYMPTGEIGVHICHTRDKNGKVANSVVIPASIKDAIGKQLIDYKITKTSSVLEGKSTEELKQLASILLSELKKRK